MLEIFTQGPGFRPGYEATASMLRQRYRLSLHPNIGPVGPRPDSSLFIVHYTQLPASHRIPVSMVPMTPQVRQTMEWRRAVESMNYQPAANEFMLEDRSAWPRVHSPSGILSQYNRRGFMPPSNLSQMTRGQRPSQPFFGQQIPAQVGGAGPPPAKRMRSSGPMPIGPMAQPPLIHDRSLEEEEYYYHGDQFDLISPQEISAMRYKQHHDWMDEILNSPFTLDQITPIDLGLGLMGELGPLTDGLFDVPSSTITKQERDQKYKPIEPAQLQEFGKRVDEHIRKQQALIDEMKASHAQRVEEIRKSELYKDGEGQLKEAMTGQSQEKVADVLEKIRASAGVDFVERTENFCVQKGGLQEEETALSQSEVQVNGRSQKYVSQDYMWPDNFDGQKTTRPGNDGSNTPHSDMRLDHRKSTETAARLFSRVSTPMDQQPPFPLQNNAPFQPPQLSNRAADTLTSGMQDGPSAPGVHETDWVMVRPQTDGTSESDHDLQRRNRSQSRQQSNIPTPGPSAPGETPGFEFDGFADLDTAGEALEGYGEGDDDMVDFDGGQFDEGFGGSGS